MKKKKVNRNIKTANMKNKIVKSKRRKLNMLEENRI